MARTKDLSLNTLSGEYRDLISTMVIRTSWQDAIDRRARIIISNKARYMTIQNATGVPWTVVGVIHNLEGSNDFGTHLHNGDSLNRRTVNVPVGQPKASPANGSRYTWEESAIDAIKFDGLDKITDWSPENQAYALEKYNGFGYRTRKTGINSPYLWSGTNHYDVGKFVRDGKYVASAKSAQAGCMPILKRVADLDITPKEVIASSRKGNFLSTTRKAVVTTVTTVTGIDYMGIGGQYWDKIQTVIGNNKLLFAAGIGGAVWVTFKVIEKMMVNEYADGSYTPSKLVIPAADGEIK